MVHLDNTQLYYLLMHNNNSFAFQLNLRPLCVSDRTAGNSVLNDVYKQDVSYRISYTFHSGKTLKVAQICWSRRAGLINIIGLYPG